MAAKKTATLDHNQKEGHGDDSPSMGVSRGSFVKIGTQAPLSHSAISVNRKTGHSGDGDQ